MCLMSQLYEKIFHTHFQNELFTLKKNLQALLTKSTYTFLKMFQSIFKSYYFYINYWPQTKILVNLWALFIWSLYIFKTEIHYGYYINLKAYFGGKQLCTLEEDGVQPAANNNNFSKKELLSIFIVTNCELKKYSKIHSGWPRKYVKFP